MSAWQSLNPVQKKNLLLLGGLFFTQAQMAARLGTTLHAVTSFCHTTIIHITKTKLPWKGLTFEEVDLLFRQTQRQPDGFDGFFICLSVTTRAALEQARAAVPDSAPAVRFDRPRKIRPIQDEDFNIGGTRSPYPAPTKECPFDIIAYFAREVYEKPFEKASEL